MITNMLQRCALFHARISENMMVASHYSMSRGLGSPCLSFVDDKFFPESDQEDHSREMPGQGDRKLAIRREKDLLVGEEVQLEPDFEACIL